VGKTPIREPVLVSVGHRKVVASMAGRLPVTEYVDVAAGDEPRVTLSLPPAGDLAAGLATKREERSTSASASAPAPAPDRPGLRTTGWIVTGVLAAGAVTFGVLALNEARTLHDARSALTTSSTLSHDANLTTTYAALADGLAAGAVVLGALSLYWTLSSPGGAPSSGGAPGPSTRVAFGFGTAHFETTF
jgi:hypothetical protein